MDYFTKFITGKFFPSLISEDDIENAENRLKLPEGYKIRKAEATELPHTLNNPNEICCYWDHIRLGLTFANLSIFAPILNISHFTFSMLTPNSICLILSLYHFCQEYNITWSSEVFFYLFKVTPAGHYVAFRPRPKNLSTFGLESSIHSWKVKYFIIQSPNGWDFPTAPGTTTYDLTGKQPYPASLKEWFDSKPAELYVFDAKRKEMLTGHEATRAVKIKGKTKISLPPAKKQKIEAKEEDVKGKRKVSSSSSSESSSDSSSSSSSDDSPVKKVHKAEERVDEDVDIISIEKGDSEGKKKAGDQGPSSPRVVDSLFINTAGNLEISKNCNVPLVETPFKNFGPLIAHFTKSESETDRFKTLALFEQMQLFHSSLMTAGRIGMHINEAREDICISLSKMKSRCKAAESELEQAKDVIADLADKAKGVSDENAVLEIGSLKGELQTVQEYCLAQVKIVAEQRLEITEKDRIIAELKKQLDDQPSSSTILTPQEHLEKSKGTLPYALEMGSFLNQGFEKFRRAALRRFSDPKDITILEGIDYLVAEDEEVIPEDDDEDDDDDSDE